MKHHLQRRLLLGALLKRKSRVSIALLSLIVGSMVVFAMMTIYYDIPKQFDEAFRSYGANMVIIPNEGERHISKETVRSLKENMPKEETLSFSPYQYEMLQINHQNYLFVGGNYQEMKKANPYWLVDGEWPSQSNEILVGAEVAERTQKTIGDDIELTAVDPVEMEGQWPKKYVVTYQISGIVRTGGKEESEVFVSDEETTKLFPKKSGYDVIECSVKGDTMTLERLTDYLNERSPHTMTRLARRLTKSQDQVLAKIIRLLWLIVAIISLLTAISVMTTMFAMVTERVQEIGLKKALGASERTIIYEFLLEGVLLSIVGSIVGIICGQYFAQLMARHIFARMVSFYPWLVIVVITLFMGLTMLASWIPIRRTAEISPDIVLRGE